MLELNDIQYIVLARAPAVTGRYEFLSFRDGAAGRAWLAGILDRVPSVEQVLKEPVPEKRTREKMSSEVLRRPFPASVLGFPWYPMCLPQWLGLAAGLLFLGILMEMVRSLWPV